MKVRQALADAAGPAYAGKAGVTRTESLHLRQAGGALRTVEVYRVVNVATHPELRERVLQGQLNRFADGGELAVPFVYHDPEALRFALVIPPSLAHLELKERAQLMTELAADSAQLVPQYVREGVTVLGVGELRRYLGGTESSAAEGPSRSSQPPSAALGLDAAHPDAEDSPRSKQGIFSGLAQLLHVSRSEFGSSSSSAKVAIGRLASGPRPGRRGGGADAPGSSAEALFARLRSRPRVPPPPAPRPPEAVASLPSGASSVRPRQEESAPAPAPPPSRASGAPPESPPVVATLPRATRGLPPLPRRPLVYRPNGAFTPPSASSPSAVSGRSVTPPPIPPVPVAPRASAAIGSRPSAATPTRTPVASPDGIQSPAERPSTPAAPAAGVLAAKPPLPPPPRPPGPVPGPLAKPFSGTAPTQPKVRIQARATALAERGATRATPAAPAPPADARPASPAAPVPPAELPPGPVVSPSPPVGSIDAQLEALPVLGMLVACEGKVVRLFVKLDDDCSDAYDDEAELLVQLAVVGGRPLVVLALLGLGDVVARLVLDGLAAETHALLERLASDFRAELVVCVGTKPDDARPIFAPRELNAKAILTRLREGRFEPELTPPDAIARCSAEPPPVRDPHSPFGPARLPPASAATVMAAVGQLEQWREPARVDEALLQYSVPKHVCDAWYRRVLRSALTFGIAVPDSLTELLLEQQLAPNHAAFVRDQLHAFRTRVERGDNDLDARETQRNWDRLVAQARALGVAVDPSLYGTPTVASGTAAAV